MLKVVVIDGNAISRNLLTTLLVNGGYEVIGDANTSSASLAQMIKLKPQLVCVDAGPLDAGGLEILDTLRNGLPKSLVFLVSGNMDAATVQCALERNVNGFIVKPFKADTVLGTIRNGIMKVVKTHQSPRNSATE